MCSICLTNLNKYSLTTSCGHSFHKTCFRKYFDTKIKKCQEPTCPYCRSNLLNDLNVIQYFLDSYIYIKYIYENIFKISNVKIIHNLLLRNPTIIKYFPFHVRDNKNLIIKLVQYSNYYNQSILEFISPRLLSDKDVILAAVKSHGNSLQWASDELKSDKEVVLEAVSQNNIALKWTSPTLRDDKEIIMAAIKEDNKYKYPNSSPLRWASKRLRSDEEIVWEAVKKDGNAIKYTSSKFKKNKDLVLEAVKTNGNAIQWVSNNLKNDRNIVEEAIKETGTAIQWISKDFYNDTNLILNSINNFNPYDNISMVYCKLLKFGIPKEIIDNIKDKQNPNKKQRLT